MITSIQQNLRKNDANIRYHTENGMFPFEKKACIATGLHNICDV